MLYIPFLLTGLLMLEPQCVNYLAYTEFSSMFSNLVLLLEGLRDVIEFGGYMPHFQSVSCL